MEYSTLGNTGLKVSRLGFGCMRLPMNSDTVNRDLAIPMIHRALDAGVNYVDTAVGYCRRDSQRALGEALDGRRQGIVVSTKNPYYEEDERMWRQNLEDSLERLRVEYIDIYNTHALNRKKYENGVKPRVSKWLRKAKDEGLIGHIATSFHDTCDTLRSVVDSGLYESITLQYNILNRDLEEGLAYAHEKGMGVVVMGPVGGGRLGADSEILSDILPDIKRIPELALKFVMANPNVNVTLSGMSTMEQVEENIAVAEDPNGLTDPEVNTINEQIERLKLMADVYCTGCNYCKPCPKGVNISRVFDIYNDARVYGLWANSRKRYAEWMKNTKEGNLPADGCVDCGECLEKCPQNIPINEKLKRIHRELTGA